MKNIHLLPTPKPSRLVTEMGFKNYLKSPTIGDLDIQPQNIYITSDEYIGLSYYLDGDLVRKSVINDIDYWVVRKDYKKIILTTDQDLINDGVQAIPDEFLEWFVKNPSCDEIEIQENYTQEQNACKEVCEGTCHSFFECKYVDETDSSKTYKIIIPKEEPKQDYSETYNKKDDELRSEILNKYLESKQETLEEAAEKHFLNSCDAYGINDECRNSFIAGAKWQQERSYSEEEVLELLEKHNGAVLSKHYDDAVLDNKKWFEQLKINK